MTTAEPDPNTEPKSAGARHLTPHITGSKKQSEERAALFAVRVHVIVMPAVHPKASRL